MLKYLKLREEGAVSMSNTTLVRGGALSPAVISIERFCQSQDRKRLNSSLSPHDFDYI